MATRIPRHDFRTDNAAEAMKPVIAAAQEAIAGIETSEDDRYDALTFSLGAAKWHCLPDPTAGELDTWESWVLAMQVGSALFLAGTTQESTVACRVGTLDEVRTLPRTGPQDYLHAGNWLTSFYLAVICRENDRVSQLAQVPVSFLRASGAEFDEYVYAWIETLQHLWFGRAQVWDSLVIAVQGTAPEQARIADTELMLKILYPPLELFQLYLRRENQAFTESLVGALMWHKEYWTADEARSLSGDGLVALGPLAIACMAQDAGMPVEVESEYLPKHLLQRSWIGEFPT
ncbi:immunity 49 family protein [Streptomyces sp. NBC_01433]|uniref:immunity 49 family protein n=1 Tax=Streptomyces sp. NBC_01433 TaxID=2903864 RepID=UPI00224EB2C7|nr:immunity 49 family protein [Streptomyces sp. NBC_01433]MCX4677093.1 immunity 49 family protein [Streptomyces sp. NBC_01433]